MNSPKRLLNRKLVQSQFDRAATTYDRAAGLQKRMGNRLLHRIRSANIPADSPIIDLGCGTGELLRDLSVSGYRRLVGLDLSSQMIEVAARKSPAAEFLHADIESIACEDDRFEVVVSNAAVQWCDIDQAACEMARVLCPGGHLFLNSFTAGTLRQWHDAFVAGGFESRVHSLVSVAEIESALVAAGFDAFKVEVFSESMKFETIGAMFDSVRKIGATNASPTRAKSFSRREYSSLRAHFETLLQTHGTLELDYVWTQVEAKKKTR